MKKFLTIILAVVVLFGCTLVGCNENPPTTRLVTIVVNNSEYGSVDKNSVTVTDNAKISVNGNQITIGDQKITVTATQSTAQYAYEFSGIDYIDYRIKEDVTITVNFVRTDREYQVTFLSLGEEFCDGQTLVYGEKVVLPDGTPQKSSDARHEYGFDGWFNGETKWDFEKDTITDDLVLTAKFKITATFSEEFLPS